MFRYSLCETLNAAWRHYDDGNLYCLENHHGKEKENIFQSIFWPTDAVCTTPGIAIGIILPPSSKHPQK